MKPEFIPPRYISLPDVLLGEKRWLRWDYRLVKDRWSKVPYAKSNDPSTWSYLDELHGRESDGIGIGLGFRLCGIDLDCCRNPKDGSISVWAKPIIELFSNSYIEVSPSATGLHILFTTAEELDLPGIKHGGKEQGWEIAFYAKERYFAMTGVVFEEHAVLNDIQVPLVRNFYNDLVAGRFDVTPQTALPPRTVTVQPPPNNKLIHLFEKGWEGSGYQSQSEADMAACAMLAGGLRGPEIDYLMRRSALYREKWDDERYRERTIQKVLSSQKKPSSGTTQPVLTIRMKGTDEDTAMPITFLWTPYIPLGSISMLTGDPGVGKSYVSLRIAADVTLRGDTVLYFSNENPIRQVVIPRLNALGAVLSLFKYSPDGVKTPTGYRPFMFDDVVLLEELIQEYNPKLIIFDPIQSFFGADRNSDKATETRPVLDPLVSLAEKYNLSILFVRHAGKDRHGKRGIHLGLGSIDFTGVVRSEMYVGETADKQQKAMVHIKHNLSIAGDSLAYQITSDHNGVIYQAGYFEWLGQSQLTTYDLIAPEQSGSQDSPVNEAKEFLLDILKDGPVPIPEICKQGKDQNIAKRTIYRAKRDLGKLIGRLPRVEGKMAWYLINLPPKEQAEE